MTWGGDLSSYWDRGIVPPRGALLGMAMLAATSRGRITARLPAALRTCGVRSVHLKVRSCRACLSPATPHPTPLSGAAQASLADVPDSALAGKRVLVRVDFNVRRCGCCAPNVMAFTDAAAYRPQTAPAGGRQPRCGHMDASSGGALCVPRTLAASPRGRPDNVHVYVYMPTRFSNDFSKASPQNLIAILQTA